MRALWLEDRRLSLRDDVPRPAVPPGEALVRVIAAGICNTDIELTRGYYPFSGIPGHEFVGVVEDGPDTLTGRRVVGEINAACHHCEPCHRGRPTHCDNRTVLGIKERNGAFAEYLTLPAENLHVVPDDLPTEAALFTEPLAAALEIQEQVAIGSGDRVLVVGAGKLGQLIARTLALTGCRLLVAARRPRAIALLESAGIRTTSPDSIEPRSFDVAVDCSGDPAGFALARKGLRARGTLVMKSTYAGELTINASAIVVDEITLVGSRCGPFAPALRMLAEERVDPRPLIDETWPLQSAVEAFARAQQPGAMKIVVRC
jgi:threonine dehydrogenase-like Zn-dependent dehydrogenase